MRENREKLTQTVHELLVINLFMNIITYVFLFLALLMIPRLREERMLCIVIGFTIILTSIGMEWFYKALEKYTYITIRSLIFKFIALIAMFLLIHKETDYVIYGAITIFAASASNIFNFINIRKYIDMKPRKSYNLRQHMKPILVLFAVACAGAIYTNLDTVMLGLMTTNEEVGYYNAAVKIKCILVGIVTSLGAVLLPRVSYYVEQNLWSEFQNISKKAINFVIVVATPMMVFFISFAKQGIYFLSGEAFARSVIPMQIIMPTFLMIGITNILGIQILVPLGKEKVVLYSEIAGAVIDMILNALLIPRYASTGAAIGTLVAEGVVFVVQYVYLKNEVKFMFKSVQYHKIMVALLVGTLLTIRIPSMGLGNFLTLMISACIYFGVYGVVLVVSKEPLSNEICKQLIVKIKKR